MRRKESVCGESFNIGVFFWHCCLRLLEPIMFEWKKFVHRILKISELVIRHSAFDSL